MHDNYDDIKKRIPEAPRWYDENGCPRYDDFSPEYCPDIYARTVVLLRIACQYCNQQFLVELSGNVFDKRPSDIKKWHYGDPPRHNCPGGGDTMNCEDLDVVEVWHCEGAGDWVRYPELEGMIP